MTEDPSHLIHRSKQRGDIRRYQRSKKRVIDGEQVTEFSLTTIDSEGETGAPAAEVIDELLKLYTDGLITEERYNVGVDFRNDFQRSGLVGIKAADLHRTGGSWSDPITGSLEAKRRTHEALRAVGGLFTSKGLVAWHILGEERTFEGMLEYIGVFFMNPRIVLIQVLEDLDG